MTLKASQAALAAGLTCVLLAGCAPNTPSERDIEIQRYVQDCRDRGGYVSAHSGWSEVVRTCVGQTTGPTMPELSR